MSKAPDIELQKERVKIVSKSEAGMEPRGLEGTMEERDGGRDQPVNSGVFYHIRACVTTDRDVTVTRVTTCRSDFNTPP
jgi:hypothetical protein